MITKEETSTLKVHLKTNYIKDVLKELESKQITSKTGEPFSDTYISAVLNGRKENLDIEDAIFMVYQKRVYEFNKREKVKSKLLSK
jgi:protein-disulfide isomerase-like protein with CxxC motif